MKMKKMITGGNTGSEIDMKSLCNCKFQIRDFLLNIILVLEKEKNILTNGIDIAGERTE